MIYDYKELHSQIRDFLQHKGGKEIQHIGKTLDSLVFGFKLDDRLVCKCVIKDYGIRVWKEVEVLDQLYTQNSCEYLATPINKWEIDEPHMLHTLVLYVFPRYDYSLDTYHVNSGQDHSIELTRQLFVALSTLHSMGYYHGDLKPLNICVHDSNIRLIDYGTTGIYESLCQYRKNSIGWCTPVQFIKMVRKCVQTPASPLLKVMDAMQSFIVKKYGYTNELHEDPKANDEFVASMISVYMQTGRNFWEYNADSELYDNIIVMMNNVALFLGDPEKYIANFRVEIDMAKMLGVLKKTSLTEN